MESPEVSGGSATGEDLSYGRAVAHPLTKDTIACELFAYDTITARSFSIITGSV